MAVKGITWVGNIYQKFENMYLEAEDIICEDTVKYIENQMQTVGESVKKLCADVMRDLLPPSSCDLEEKVASELPTQGSKEKPVKTDSKQTTKGSKIDHAVVNDVIHAAASCDGSRETDALFTLASRGSVKGRNFISHSREKLNLGVDENRQNKTNAASITCGEITLAEADTCRTSESTEISNQNDAVTVLKPASAEVTRPDSVADCCIEIENASTELFSIIPLLVKSAEEKDMNMSSCSSGCIFREPDGFSMDRTKQTDDDSYKTVILSHPDPWSLDATKVDTIIKQGLETMQQDDELTLEETCVVVTGDESQLVPRASGYLKANKKKMQQRAFSLSKKSARKQEYEELALWHKNSEKGEGECKEKSDSTLLEDRKKLLLLNVSEPEWELL